MSWARLFAGLMLLSVLAASAPPEGHPEPGGTPRSEVIRVLPPEGQDRGLLSRATPVESLPFAARPVDEARRTAASQCVEEFSGGPTGALLTGAALIAAVALILAAVMRW